MYIDNDKEAYFRVGKLLVKKWAPLLEGIEGEYNIISTALLLENESQHGCDLMTEAGTLSGTPGMANPNIAQFQHYLLPLVRRVYPNLIANELVGVQPMTSPASLVFYLKYYYTGLVNGCACPETYKKKGNTGGGSKESGLATEYANFVGNTWGIDPYYSLQTVYREDLDVNTVATIRGIDATNLRAFPVIDGTAYITAMVISAGFPTPTDVAVIRFPVAVTTSPVTWTGAALTANVQVVANVLGTAFVPATELTNLTASINPTTNQLSVTATWAAATYIQFLGSAGVASLPAAIANVWNGVVTKISYDYNMENNKMLPEIDLSVERNAVEAKTRKLRTKWSVEASQDLRAMHNIDAEKELVALLANEVAAEIDREILNTLIVNAGIRTDYDYSNPFVAGGYTTYAGAGATGTFPIIGAGNFDDRNRSLLYQIVESANQIYRQSLRGSGNWIVTSPEIAAKLESLREFNADAMSDFTYNLGIQASGTLQNKFKLYKDPLFKSDLILIGFKGSSFMDAGFFYCPYVPLQITPTVLDPESFNPRKGLLTRYGTVMVENGPRMYAVIKVNNLTAYGATPYAPITTSVQSDGRELVGSQSPLV